MNERSTIWDCFDAGAVVLLLLETKQGHPCGEEIQAGLGRMARTAKAQGRAKYAFLASPLEGTLVGLRVTKVLLFGESRFGAQYRRHLRGARPPGLGIPTNRLLAHFVPPSRAARAIA